MGLTSLVALSSAPLKGVQMGGLVFEYVNTGSCTLYVPYGSKNAYTAASQWKDFTNILELGMAISSSPAHLAPNANSSTTFNISTPKAWTAVSSQPWLSLSDTSGTGSAPITVTATTANTMGSPRTATITISASSETDQVVTITQKGKPIINWGSPSDIVYGTLLNNEQLNASSEISGSFIYSPPISSKVKAGSNKPLITTFIPRDTSSYISATDTVYINVSKANLSVIGTVYNKIYDGTKTASIYVSQLIGVVQNIVTSDIVNLTYPQTGTFSSANVGNGINVTANLSLSGSDAGNYTLIQPSLTGNITPAFVTVTAEHQIREYFTIDPIFTMNYSGFVNGETDTVITKKPTVTITGETYPSITSEDKNSPPGDYLIMPSGAISHNYAFGYEAGLLTINPSTIQICLVTVDLQSGYNLVVWEPNRSIGIKEYNIYKQGNQAGVYNKLTPPVSIDSAGLFLDGNSKNEVQAEFYKITAVDSFGNESDPGQSNYHKTMFLQYNGNNQGVNLNWSSYEIEGNPIAFPSYVIYRGTDSTMLTILDTVPSNNNLFTDTSAQSQISRTFYRIGGMWTNGCDPTVKGPKGKKSYSTSISNIENNRVYAKAGGNGVNKVFENSLNLNIYPNPGKGDVTITYTLQTTSNVRLVVTDLTGKEVAIIEKSKHPAGESKLQLNTNEFGRSSGVYFIKLIIGNNIVTRKMVVVK